jgi:aminopeptidase N
LNFRKDLSLNMLIEKGLSYVLVCLSLGAFQLSLGQYRHEDILDYNIRIAVSDSSNVIKAHETIKVLRESLTDSIFLDLVDGMKIKALHWDNKSMSFDHKQNILTISPSAEGSLKTTIDLWYEGVPSDGLIIGKNKYNERTFFGDNWPNRAHHWFACNDHPSDKATYSFTVTAPDKYKVVSNGSFVGKNGLGNGLSVWSYRSEVPLPSKVAVVGVAVMEWKDVAIIDSVQVTSAVYPKNSSKSFKDLDVATDILRFFSIFIAPYEFEKLMNVQSTTRYGGMENAGCIFYDENALNGKGTAEALVAHEIAHQWFGNSVTERDWEHVWLSEGFATYMTNIYLQNRFGDKRFKDQLRMDREEVISFHRKYDHPLVDTKYGDLNRLLNPNTYQKGSWLLHMLRCKLGDSLFQQGLKDYYQTFRLGNADSEDFKNAMEVSTGVELGAFFENWLYKPGHPVLKTVLDQSEGKKLFIVRQTQESIFQFDLKVEFELENGEKHTEVFAVDEMEEQIILPSYEKKIFAYKLDPGIELLYEEIN